MIYALEKSVWSTKYVGDLPSRQIAVIHWARWSIFALQRSGTSCQKIRAEKRTRFILILMYVCRYSCTWYFSVGKLMESCAIDCKLYWYDTSTLLSVPAYLIGKQPNNLHIACQVIWDLSIDFKIWSKIYKMYVCIRYVRGRCFSILQRQDQSCE